MLSLTSVSASVIPTPASQRESTLGAITTRTSAGAGAEKQERGERSGDITLGRLGYVFIHI
jgi:hypothetical protein